MVSKDHIRLSNLIKTRALELGFDLCGIAGSRPLEEHIPYIKEWCSSGMHSGMDYLCRDIGKRSDPEQLLPGARSVIVTALNYYTNLSQSDKKAPVLSRYAFGKQYQPVIKERLTRLLDYVRSICPDTDGRVFSDTGPVLEKAWAREAGLGWPGKHSVLINDRIGSFFFLGVLLLDIDLAYDKPYEEARCGNCRICIDSCPVQAINENNTIDTRKCIAYLTIESKVPVPVEMADRFGRRVFGCDRCQEVCPWNKMAVNNIVPEFRPDPEMLSMNEDNWLNLREDEFEKMFGETPLGRKKYKILMENIRLVIGTDT
jgi:epoxyqueuosine reductase